MPFKRVLLPALLCFASLPAAGQELLAGVARIEITHSTNGPMFGYANRKCGLSTAVHDPLYAKALVLQAGEQRGAIVTLDL